MSKPIDWEGANKTLNPPEGYEAEQVTPMRIFSYGVICVSKWKLSPEAISEIANTGCLFISLISGPTQPPVFIGSEEECRALAIDYGPVWK
jgi:hypothetical protein